MAHSKSKSSVNSKQQGIALLLVLFIVALATILVVSLSYSTYLSSRANLVTERSLQAEYLLKSTLNLSRVLIKNDKTSEDSKRDPWGMFSEGHEVPASILGINEPGLKIELQIRPEETKLSVAKLVLGGSLGAPEWRDALVRLFQLLNFDNDGEEVKSGPFQGKHFSSAELVANLIDYMDPDITSFDDPSFGARGIESDLPEGTFQNSPMTRIGELNAVPGFTPARVQKLLPFVTVVGNRINLNLAPPIILKALDPAMGETEVERMNAFRDSDKGPFDSLNKDTELPNLIGSSTYNNIRTLVDVTCSYFEVIAKVDYGTASYYLRAVIAKTSSTAGALPDIESMELY